MCQAEDGKRPMVWLAELDTLKLSNLHVGEHSIPGG
jgi:hypothetical protein